MDAVIHNAGVYASPKRVAGPDGHSRTLAVNVLAPYLLTALIERPRRLVYISSGMHHGADGSLRDIDWTERRWNAGAAYSESKLYVSALSASVARHWPGVLSNSVDPGWVPTRMGGPGAPDDLALGQDTQSWLAVSNDPAALVSGKYWHHRRQRTPAPEVMDTSFQDRLTDRLAEITGITLF
jgi:NAD(P)-dependent dehydrogenase (short-subunit alcohol dehydrogenase family)